MRRKSWGEWDEEESWAGRGREINGGADIPRIGGRLNSQASSMT